MSLLWEGVSDILCLVRIQQWTSTLAIQNPEISSLVHYWWLWCTTGVVYYNEFVYWYLWLFM